MSRTLLIAVVSALLLGTSGLLLAQSSLPPAKQAIEQQYSQERATGAANPAPKNPNAPYPIVPATPFQSGIVTICGAPFSSQSVNIYGCWQGIVNGAKTRVYVGNDATDPLQGEVIIMSDATSTIPTIVAPVRDTGLNIASAQGDVLTLVTNSGYIFTFDVATRKFTSSRIPGDLNDDGVVDQKDLNLILSALNQPVAKPFDPRDLNYDGVINVLDARKLILLCTHPRCASQ